MNSSGKIFLPHLKIGERTILIAFRICIGSISVLEIYGFVFPHFNGKTKWNFNFNSNFIDSIERNVQYTFFLVCLHKVPIKQKTKPSSRRIARNAYVIRLEVFI